MPEENRDFPSLEGITEYMVPGPGMSALEPWMDPPPESAVATAGSEEPEEPESSEASPEANGWEVEGMTTNTWDAEAETPDFLQQELAPILASARRAAAEIVDRAKTWVRTETVELEQMRQLLEERAAELAAWQHEVEPAVREVLAKMGSVRSQIDEVPELIRVSLRTLATTISSLDPTLSELTQRSSRMLSLEPLPEQYLHRSDGPTS